MSEKHRLLVGDKKPSTVKVVLIKAGRGAKSVLGLQSSDGQGKFTSSLGVMLAMLGCVVGTGNIWRFPRILASHAEEGGALVFLMVWFGFLWLWSIPIILIEYGVGRFTHKSVVESFNQLLGPAFRWMGGFLAVIALLIGSYYSVLLGYCVYYVIFFMIKELPESLETAEQHFDDLQAGYWPILCHFVSVTLACLSLSRGVSTIEPVNRIIVPILLAIVVFSFYWALYLPYAGMGIIHMFSPNWESFKDASLWRDALTQNAWDTGAGAGLFLTYATFMRRDQGAVKLGTVTPVVNNIVSMLCGMTVFCNVFSYEYQKGSEISEIVDVLKTNGPFNTGITFIWMPLLYGSLTGGRILTILFFLCISLAGLSSLIALLEQAVHVLQDFGLRRIVATILVFVVSFSVGLASALDSSIFVNQDAVWSQALILSGCFLIFLVVYFGIRKFRRDFFNSYGINDWPLPLIWMFVILFLAPIEGVGMLVWWVVDEVIHHSDPYEDYPWWGISSESLMMTLSQWVFVFCILIGLNWWMAPISAGDNTTQIYLQYQPWYRRLGNRIKAVLLKRSDNIFDPGQATTPTEDASHVTESGKEEYPMSGDKRTPPSLVVVDVEL